METKEISENDTQDLLKRAMDLNIHIPNYVKTHQVAAYKIAYLQVSENPETSKMPAMKRKQIILNLANRFLNRINKLSKEGEDNENKTRKDECNEAKNDKPIGI